MLRVREGRLPFDFGSPHPHVRCLEQDGMFRIRQLVEDMEEEMRAAAKARAEGLSFQPEHAAAIARPTGEIYAAAKTRDELLAIMETMDWPPDW